MQRPLRRHKLSSPSPHVEDIDYLTRSVQVGSVFHDTLTETVGG